MLNYIKLFWFKPGSSKEDVFDPLYGKQYEVMTDFCFGVFDGTNTLKGQAAVDRLMVADWDGKTFAEHIPIIPANPPQYIEIALVQKRYPMDIPAFRNEVYRGYNEAEIDEHGNIKWCYLYAIDESWLKLQWDGFHITHWEDPLLAEDDTSWIPNPEYDVWLAAKEAAMNKWASDIAREWSNGCQLIFLGTAIFPVIADGPDVKWRIIQPDGTRIPIPVEVGKYPPEKKYRVRKVVDYETGNRTHSRNMLVNNTVEYAKMISCEDAVKYLTGVVRNYSF